MEDTPKAVLDLEAGNVDVNDDRLLSNNVQQVITTAELLPSPPASIHEKPQTTKDISNALEETGEELASKKPPPPLLITHTLPPIPKHHWLIAYLRHATFTVYRRLFILVLIPNILGFVLLTPALHAFNFDYYLKVMSTCASANLFLAITIRQDYIINFLCEAAVRTPKSSPLRLRRVVAKIYEFGGIHSGAAVCSVGWFIRLAVLLTFGFQQRLLRDCATLVLTYILLVVFLGIIIFAYPSLRRKMHDTFERTHRFAGMISNIVFWTLIVLCANALAARHEDPRSTGQVLVTLPSFYLLSINTIHAFLPWLRLRRLKAVPEPLSDHALRLHLNANVGPFYTIRISDRPLTEWHAFAIFLDDTAPVTSAPAPASAATDPSIESTTTSLSPSQAEGNTTASTTSTTTPEEKQTPTKKKDKNAMTNSLVISRAGDWTSRTIASPAPWYWTRGLPTRGVLYTSLLFHRIVLITTGSGIGPCLNLLSMAAGTRPEVRVLWSTPSPVATFGKEIVDTVRKADQEAVIWDTKVNGRPDMVALTWELMMRTKAEACFVISNPRVTRKVVYALEARGVAAYAPIFDS